jgi:hypothetical protein
MTDENNNEQGGTSIKVGNISGTSGTINLAGGNITTHHITSGLSAADIKQLFDQVYTQIDAHPAASATDREDIKAEVQEIQETVTQAAQKNEKVDEGFLAKRFRNIARVAPDLLDNIVGTLGKPLAGLGVALKAIAQKAKDETRR